MKRLSERLSERLAQRDMSRLALEPARYDFRWKIVYIKMKNF